MALKYLLSYFSSNYFWIHDKYCFITSSNSVNGRQKYFKTINFTGQFAQFLRERKLRCRFKSRRNHLQFFCYVFFLSSYFYPLACFHLSSLLILFSFARFLRYSISNVFSQMESGCFWILLPKKANENNNFFCSGIINLLSDGLAYNRSGHFAYCFYFSSPLRGSEKYNATRKISARIICYTNE